MSRLITLIAASTLLAVGTSAFPQQITTRGLPNFGTVDPGLYRGAAPEQKGPASLKSIGVQTVIDLRISPKRVKSEALEITSLGMKFVNIPMGSDPPTPAQEKKFLSIVSDANQHPVYVHCQYGADRTGVMIGLYRRIDDHWTYAQTYQEMRHYGFKPYYTKLAATVKNATAG